MIPQSSGDAAYLMTLNAEQRQAVTADDGPLLVLAGAGTGKTRVLTTRLGHLLMTGRVRPHEVLAVTFTNKAAREMVERVSHMLGRSVEGLWLGTFHAIGVRMLAAYPGACGIPTASHPSRQRKSRRIANRLPHAPVNRDAQLVEPVCIH